MEVKVLLMFCLVAVSVCCSVAGEGITVVILTGRNNHDWQRTTPVLKEILGSAGTITVDVVEAPEELTEKKLAEYDVILSNWNNWPGGRNRDLPPAAPWSEELKTAYIGFVRNGGGHVMVHAGSSSFFEWEDYQDICCATWKMGQTGHGKKHEFEVRISGGEHPLTEGMEDFRTKDELWYRPAVRPGVRVLAEAYSAKTGGWEPSAMVRHFGKGRCFALLLGHGPEFMRPSGFQSLLVRGTEWAAGVR